MNLRCWNKRVIIRQHSLGTLLLLVVLTALVGSCRTLSDDSQALEVTNVTKDGKKAMVIWRDKDTDMVNYHICDPIPVPSSLCKRGYAAKKPLGLPISYQEYVARMTKYLVSLRKDEAAGARAKVLVEIISRLELKINDSSTDSTDRDALKRNLVPLKVELEGLKQDLTEAEKKLMVDILSALEESRDITNDQGEKRFALSQAPFSEVAAGPEPVPEPKLCSKRNSYGMVFCDIPSGTFTMGTSPMKEEYSSNNEEPAHQVTLSKDFEMMSTEVTQAMWSRVCQGMCKIGDNPSEFQGHDRPVEGVSWNDIVDDFLPKLNEKLKSEGYNYRLPTEAEWEYAARGKKTGPYGVDGNLREFCWFDNKASTSVGKLKSNKYGLFDMHGNVSEWVQDAHAKYSSSAVTDPLVTAGFFRVIRGGSWGSTARNSRSASRNGVDPGGRHSGVGFRLVRTR